MTRLLYDIEDYLEDAAHDRPRPALDAPDHALDRPHRGRDGRPYRLAPRRVLDPARTAADNQHCLSLFPGGSSAPPDLLMSAPNR